VNYLNPPSQDQDYSLKYFKRTVIKQNNIKDAFFQELLLFNLKQKII